jgi:hypothetical protein
MERSVIRGSPANAAMPQYFIPHTSPREARGAPDYAALHPGYGTEGGKAYRVGTGFSPR